MRRYVALSCWLCLVTAALALLLLGDARTARADWPPDESKGPVDYKLGSNWPADPGYQGMWEMWSFLPDVIAKRAGVSEQNKRLGTGCHLDRAWAKTTGDRRVIISVLDSGIEWEQRDLVNKWHLNDLETPAPDKGCMGGDGTKRDVNGDGIFNVQDFTTATGHGQPTFDKVCDTRLKAKGDTNGNGILDPEDLIVVFSDGKDDDGNGFVDDISGWDFFHNDNDPFDDTLYGHGTGESKDSSSEGNNGIDDIGTCPECSVMNLRVGDSFVADSSAFGMAVIYAVDNGVSVVQEALGTVNNTRLAQAAMDYAYKNNVAVMASAADENSYHHNMPGTNNHTFYVHAITHDADGSWQNANTFLNFNNCTNYGGNLLASVAGGSCSSEAVGKISGMAGLLYSAALKANVKAPPGAVMGDPSGNRRLSAEEVYQILKLTTDDLFDPADATDPTRYATLVGWDQRFGYGRINARSAVDAVLGGKIPPEVEIRTPTWYEVIHPEVTPKVMFDGRINVGHAMTGDTFDFVLEYHPGVEPDNTTGWVQIAKGDMVGMAMDGTLATWDVTSLTIDNPTQGPPDGLTNRRAVTIRLKAKINSMDPMRNGTQGETRRTLFIEHDPDLVAGYPIRLGTGGEMSGKIVDINGDGKREIIYGDGAGLVHAFTVGGRELAGWPVKANLLPGLDPAQPNPHVTAPAFTKGGISADYHSSMAFSVAVGDIDGDGKPEVVAGTYDGFVYAWHGDGTVVKGWPFQIDTSTRQKTDPDHVMGEGIEAAPALADFDGDGKLEVVVACMNALVYVLKGDGTPLAAFNGGKPVVAQDPLLSATTEPKQQRQRIVSSPALGDLNGDKIPDIAFGTNENYDGQARLYAVDGKTGAYLPGWPITVVSTYVLPVVGSGMPNAPAMADLDGDGVPEILVGAIGGAMKAYDSHGKIFGKIFPNSNIFYGPKSDAVDATSFVPICNPAIGDIDDDGVLDVANGTDTVQGLLGLSGGKRRDAQHLFSVWDTKTGLFKEGFPRVIEDWQFFNNPAFADIDGDGHTEVMEGSGGYYVHAWRADGTEPKGFPKLTGGWITSSVAVGDMDGDGKLEYFVTTRDGWLYAWHGGGPSDGRIDWPSFHHDNANTGNFATKLDQGGKKGGDKVLTGGGCTVGRASSPLGARAAWPLALLGALLGALVIARRRRG